MRFPVRVSRRFGLIAFFFELQLLDQFFDLTFDLDVRLSDKANFARRIEIGAAHPMQFAAAAQFIDRHFQKTLIWTQQPEKQRRRFDAPLDDGAVGGRLHVVVSGIERVIVWNGAVQTHEASASSSVTAWQL